MGKLLSMKFERHYGICLGGSSTPAHVSRQTDQYNVHIKADITPSVTISRVDADLFISYDWQNAGGWYNQTYVLTHLLRHIIRLSNIIVDASGLCHTINPYSTIDFQLPPAKLLATTQDDYNNRRRKRGGHIHQSIKCLRNRFLKKQREQLKVRNAE